jgi:tRNA modification GTPase
MDTHSTIAAPATGEGGAIALIRVSGPQAIAACEGLFRSANGRRLHDRPGYTLLYGTIGPPDGTAIDEVLVSVFRAPHSYTGEDLVEIGCHGSPWIRREILRLLAEAGVRAAAPGEFTLRAYLNGKMDLAQAEAVAELIAADSRAAHDLAMNQLRGGYSDEFAALRGGLIDLAALLELELDFSEEDVEFADRRQIGGLVERLARRIAALRDSYAWGNAIKEGIAVAIVGAPNVGKSTLLNALLREERALVSEIAGTTRDAIEESVTLRGVRFRFVDTAGIRPTGDPLEAMGIERTFSRMQRASVILLTAEASSPAADILSQIAAIDRQPRQQAAIVLNKIDRNPSWPALADALREGSGLPVIPLSARSGENLEALTDYLYTSAGESPAQNEVVVTSARHHEALSEASAALERASAALEAGLSADLLAEEIRGVIRSIGTITGDTPATDEVLHTIFSRFCIGK